jgi:hypothetical protein
LQGDHAPHRFTVAAQVLEHFPPKWKPGFPRQNTARKGKFAPIPVTGPIRSRGNAGKPQPVHGRLAAFRR